MTKWLNKGTSREDETSLVVTERSSDREDDTCSWMDNGVAGWRRWNTQNKTELL